MKDREQGSSSLEDVLDQAESGRKDPRSIGDDLAEGVDEMLRDVLVDAMKPSEADDAVKEALDESSEDASDDVASDDVHRKGSSVDDDELGKFIDDLMDGRMEKKGSEEKGNATIPPTPPTEMVQEGKKKRTNDEAADSNKDGSALPVGDGKPTTDGSSNPYTTGPSQDEHQNATSQPGNEGKSTPVSDVNPGAAPSNPSTTAPSSQPPPSQDQGVANSQQPGNVGGNTGPSSPYGAQPVVGDNTSPQGNKDGAPQGSTDSTNNKNGSPG